MTVLPFELRRVTAFIGPFGSGKSELAIGLATIAAAELAARPAGAPGPTQVVLGDLDVLKPYFRSREAAVRLRERGVGVVAPQGALANSDLPILSPALRGAVSRPDVLTVLDVGGDPVGARALGSISDVLGAADHDLLLVLNRYRPFMDSAPGVIAHARQIAAACHLPLTGVVSNTHMLDETTVADLEHGLELARAVAGELGVPVRLLGVPAHLASSLEGRSDLPPLVTIRRQLVPEFQGGVVLAARRPAGAQGST